MTGLRWSGSVVSPHDEGSTDGTPSQCHTSWLGCVPARPRTWCPSVVAMRPMHCSTWPKRRTTAERPASPGQDREVPKPSVKLLEDEGRGGIDPGVGGGPGAFEVDDRNRSPAWLGLTQPRDDVAIGPKNIEKGTRSTGFDFQP